MVQKLIIDRFAETASPIVQPVTKFGGQPFWLEKPTWPVSTACYLAACHHNGKNNADKIYAT